LSLESIGEWNTFLAVQAGAAATLTGLVFVAFSINQTRIMEYPGLPGRALESLLQFLTVFLVSTVTLVPKQSEVTLAVELLVIAAISWVVQVVGQIRYLMLRTGHPRWWLAHRAILAQLATVPFLLVGIMLLLGNPDALYWLAPGFVFSFLAGIVSAWVLLVEILR
jgi:hypothetical protein